MKRPHILLNLSFTLCALAPLGLAKLAQSEAGPAVTGLGFAAVLIVGAVWVTLVNIRVKHLHREAQEWQHIARQYGFYPEMNTPQERCGCGWLMLQDAQQPNKQLCPHCGRVMEDGEILSPV